ncbi:MAG TPA: helix-turn-helix domain-containing protein [Caulobacteraceae bacterium]|jgi:AcrR family transcriptional regulator|nr:helix-turn-helix domain-containing protein [Caulobacteraceae bacterium]
MGFQRRRPSQVRSRATWDAIVEAAAQVLERDGPAGFNTAAVAERAGVSIGTLYQYFADKQAILLAAAERELSGEAATHAGRQQALLRALIAFVDSIGRMARSTPARQAHAKARPAGSKRARRPALDVDLAVLVRDLVAELALTPRLQPIPVRVRRRR